MSVLYPVSVFNQPKDWQGVETTLQPHGSGFGLFLGLCELGEQMPESALIATCDSAKALSTWGLDKGADVVRWNFDLGVLK